MQPYSIKLPSGNLYLFFPNSSLFLVITSDTFTKQKCKQQLNIIKIILNSYNAFYLLRSTTTPTPQNSLNAFTSKFSCKCDKKNSNEANILLLIHN